VVVPGGRVCINIANLGRKPYIPLHAFIVEDMLELGFLMRGEIIWNKASSTPPLLGEAGSLPKIPLLGIFTNIFWYFQKECIQEKI